MCGILAMLGLEPGSPLPDPQRAFARLQRRGPDGEGSWRCRSGRAWLGHRRLAIVDRSANGAQPMVDAHGDVALTCNGEIYNAPELRRQLQAHGHRFRSQSDNEVLLHGYRQWGERELLQRVQGMFAFVLWDGARGRAVLAVDHAGMKPLFHATRGGRLYVASDADALRELLPERPALDADGLAHVLTLGYCPPPFSVWRGVHKLAPGTGMIFVPLAAPQSFRHWTPPETADDGPIDERFAALWPTVVGEHLQSDVPTGLLLSAGIDSSAVAVALAASGAKTPCTTLSLPGSDDEAPLAKATAAQLSLPHHQQTLQVSDTGELLAAAASAFDEPQGFGALLTMTMVSRAARAHTGVVLTGDGGDEAFAGYSWHRPPATAASTTVEHARLARAVADPDAPARLRAPALAALGSLSFVHQHLQRVMPRFHPAEANTLLSPLGCRYDEERYAAWLQAEDRAALPAPRRAQRLDLAGFCAGSILPKVDRATMAHGLEARCPFLDRRVLELTLQSRPLPDELLSAPKPMLRRYLAGRVPDAVLQRPKQGFSLRLGQPDVWRQRVDWLANTRLVRDGLLHARWSAFVSPEVPSADSRLFALCMLAAWAEERW